MKRILVALAALLLFAALGASAQTGTWNGKLEVQGVQLSVVFHLDGDQPTMDSPDQAAKGIPIEVERSAAGKLIIRIPMLGATYEGLWMGTQIVGTFKQMGVQLPLTLSPGEDRPSRPQTPRGPFPYTTEEVSFCNGDAVLAGTLVLPQGCSRTTPVLIMVTGSGLQNRDEEIFEHKPFAVIADALARAGVATLRYDDRGFGESTGDPVLCTTEDLKNDALAGITLLRERFDKVGVLGHSEGGTIAFMLAAEGKADYMVSLAGMVISGKELLLWQNRTLLAEAGFDKEAVSEYCTLLEKAFDARISGGAIPSVDGAELPDALKQNYLASVLQLQSPYMKYFLALDVRKVLGRITCPVLALNGTLDTQVECASNLEALRSGLPAHPLSRVEALEGLNHLFQHCTTGAVTEYRQIEESFAPEALELIVQWMAQLR